MKSFPPLGDILSAETNFIWEINFTPEVVVKHLIVLESNVSASH